MSKTFYVAALMAFAPTLALAQSDKPPLGLGAHTSYVGNDAGSGSDLDAGWRFEGLGQFQFHPHFALELGVSQSIGAEENGEDLTGTYRLEISSTDYFAGLRADTRSWGALSGYGRAGVLYYYSEVQFEESFFGIKPGGKLEEVEEGTGYYLEGGLSWQMNTNLKLDAGITWRNRRDYFESSLRPFDLEELGVTLGGVYRFR